MILNIYQQFFNPSDHKKMTHCIYGKSNTGKTQFLERWMKIFASIRYIQQHKSRFAADYKSGAVYDHTRQHPNFVVVEEGSYSDLFEHGDRDDTKLWFEGKGKAL